MDGRHGKLKDIPQIPCGWQHRIFGQYRAMHRLRNRPVSPGIQITPLPHVQTYGKPVFVNIRSRDHWEANGRLRTPKLTKTLRAHKKYQKPIREYIRKNSHTPNRNGCKREERKSVPTHTEKLMPDSRNRFRANKARQVFGPCKETHRQMGPRPPRAGLDQEQHGGAALQVRTRYRPGPRGPRRTNKTRRTFSSHPN